jgi:hypothetical protein
MVYQETILMLRFRIMSFGTWVVEKNAKNWILEETFKM